MTAPDHPGITDVIDAVVTCEMRHLMDQGRTVSDAATDIAIQLAQQVGKVAGASGDKRHIEALLIRLNTEIGAEAERLHRKMVQQRTMVRGEKPEARS